MGISRDEESTRLDYDEDLRGWEVLEMGSLRNGQFR